MGSPLSISPPDLYARIGTANAPVLLDVIRGADTARLELAPQSSGLLAPSLGLSANFPNDHEMLERGMVMYDACCAWCRSCQDQTHNWTPEVPA